LPARSGEHREQQPDQYRDDADHDQQFDQRETPASGADKLDATDVHVTDVVRQSIAERQLELNEMRNLTV